LQAAKKSLGELGHPFFVETGDATLILESLPMCSSTHSTDIGWRPRSPKDDVAGAVAPLALETMRCQQFEAEEIAGSKIGERVACQRISHIYNLVGGKRSSWTIKKEETVVRRRFWIADFGFGLRSLLFCLLSPRFSLGFH
jgi:hypothetical protein